MLWRHAAGSDRRSPVMRRLRGAGGGAPRGDSGPALRPAFHRPGGPKSAGSRTGRGARHAPGAAPCRLRFRAAAPERRSRHDRRHDAGAARRTVTSWFPRRATPGRCQSRSRSNSSAATRRSIATTSSSTRSSFPPRAHLAFPCFDQPDLKARYRLSLEVPEAGRRWPTGRQLGEAAAQPSRFGRTRVEFDETQPLPTYLFAFVAGSSRSRRPRATAARFGCSIARPTRRRSRATATPSSTCTPARSPGSRPYTAIPYSVGQVRLRADSVLPVRRHGARRRDFLQRGGPDAGRIGHAEPAARSGERHRARDRTHVVRRSGDDASGSTMCG